MNSLQGKLNILATLIFMITSPGCGLLYDCDATEDEIEAMQTDFVSEPSVLNFTFSKCNNYVEKMDEFVDEGCGTVEDVFEQSCEELVCTVQSLNLTIYALSALFSDSVTYCTYYDSMGMAMQTMADAGGCATFNSGIGYTQADANAWVTSGCDWGDSTTFNSSRPIIEDLTKMEMRISVENSIDKLPENFSNAIRKKLSKLLD